MRQGKGMRLACMAIAIATFTAGCSTTSTSSSPYVQPEGANTASVRFRVANISRWAYPNLGAVLLFHYADEQCNASPHGRYIDEIGTNKTFVSRANQSIGMPKPQEYPAYMFVERRFVADKPMVFSVVAASGGPQRICQVSHQFLPASGQMYEVAIDVNGLQDCPVQVLRLQLSGGAVVASKEPTARQLPRFCQSPSLFN